MYKSIVHSNLKNFELQIGTFQPQKRCYLINLEHIGIQSFYSCYFCCFVVVSLKTFHFVLYIYHQISRLSLKKLLLMQSISNYWQKQIREHSFFLFLLDLFEVESVTCVKSISQRQSCNYGLSLTTFLCFLTRNTKATVHMTCIYYL